METTHPMSITQTFVVKLATTQTGQTLKAKLFNASDVQQGSDVTTGFSELGNGEYRFTHTFADDFDGYVSIYIGSAYQSSSPYKAMISDVDLSSIEDELTTIENLLSGGTLTITAPVASDGTVTIVRGDDTSLVFNFTGILDLTGATVVFSAKNVQTGRVDIANHATTISNAGSPTQTVTVALVNAETSPLYIGP